MFQIARALDRLTVIFLLMPNIFELVEGGEYYLMETFLTCTLHISSGWWSQTGYAVGCGLKYCPTNRKVTGLITCGPGVDSASDINEY